MRLLEIRINGFKSFADKSVIKLHEDTTCIVGPNGSGKSNVADAVRWALGEQSVKSLRGDSSMIDIIFSGTENRKPLSAASVELIFDNADNYLDLNYAEVSVKRKLYRNGESEYFINKNKCRLKDINDLFMASGLGKSSYSIISQGEVASVLSGTPLERRTLFEDAAGILKYKMRKEEALRKLEKTKDNLKRLRDIIEEIERQIIPLKEEALLAKKYVNFKEELTNLEVNYLVKNINLNNAKVKETNAYIKNIDNDLLSLNIEKEKVEEIGRTINSKQSSYEEKYKNLNNLLLSRLEDLSHLVKEKELTHLRNTYDLDADKSKELLNRLLDNKRNVKEEIGRIEISNQNINEKITNLEFNLNNDIENFKNLNNDYNNLNSSYLQNEKDIMILINKRDFLKDNISDIKLPFAHKKLIELYNFKLFDEVINYDNKYLKVCNVALNGIKNNLIVNTKDEAIKAIEYLKKEKLGRVSFFPLDDNMFYQSETVTDKGFLGTLNNLVEIDAKYKLLVDRELSKYYIFDNIINAKNASIYGKKTLVTLDGDILRKGVITGGHLKLNASINSKIELEEVKTEINIKEELRNNLKIKLSILEEQKLNLLTKINVYKSDIELNKNIILNNENHLANLLEKVKNLEEQINDLADSKDLTNKIIGYEEAEVLIKNEIFKLKENLKNIDIEKVKLEQEEDENYVKINLIDKDILNKSKELKEKEILVNKLNFMLDKDLEYLNSEYSLSYEKALENYENKELDINRVEYLKLELKEIGMVNIRSIDRYDEENKRLEFLLNQENDLIKAEDMLFDVINDMDNIMKRDFLNSFNKIATEFSKVFESMFDGGKASLKLTSDDVLTSGIEIMASPKGKKLTTINLLSGGEKTLTVISLLFAILNTRPTPFCLFDEVEAALDTENVEKFGQYLKSYEDKTQFLIITHKEKTMEYAKALYGATMEEDGVTKIVSLKLV